MATGLTIMGLHFQQIGHFRDWSWGGGGGGRGVRKFWQVGPRDLGYKKKWEDLWNCDNYI